MSVMRDITELQMISKTEWNDHELSHYHKSLQQVVPYLNVEGQSIHAQIIKEIERRLNQQ
ncbi:hypothetical protein HHO41_13870 [Bacillus sp. DNRA2]|uniref:hypothetical protein n=1 Tax=Bacillus sp. DNRA2 TaxID=2723053 RepID=UPI00145E5C35|nr:hypothetical protein [Bacillus sp. DNRA2]NMD71388.1 hypothetical protein [Bacillus sp. DNRA2]